MKRILRLYLIETTCLYLLSLVTSGLVFEKGIETILFTGLILSITSYVARPIINVLLLPLNLITFGLFRWISSAIALYLVTLVVTDFKINGFFFQGFSTPWLDIPQITLAGILAFVAYSFILSFFTTFLHWLFK